MQWDNLSPLAPERAALEGNLAVIARVRTLLRENVIFYQRMQRLADRWQ